MNTEEISDIVQKIEDKENKKCIIENLPTQTKYNHRFPTMPYCVSREACIHKQKICGTTYCEYFETYLKKIGK